MYINKSITKGKIEAIMPPPSLHPLFPISKMSFLLFTTFRAFLSQKSKKLRKYGLLVKSPVLYFLHTFCVLFSYFLMTTPLFFTSYSILRSEA